MLHVTSRLSRAWEKTCEYTRTKVQRRLYGAIADRARLSDYFYTLDQASKKRDTQKIAIFNGEDPYWLKKDAFSQLEDDLPDYMYVRA